MTLMPVGFSLALRAMLTDLVMNTIPFKRRSKLGLRNSLRASASDRDSTQRATTSGVCTRAAILWMHVMMDSASAGVRLRTICVAGGRVYCGVSGWM